MLCRDIVKSTSQILESGEGKGEEDMPLIFNSTQLFQIKNKTGSKESTWLQVEFLKVVNKI